MADQRPGLSRGEQQHLKRVSRIKHLILEKYFAPGAMILGSRSSQLAYVDCFAGPGQYEMDGKLVEGSAVIAVKQAIKLVQNRGVQSLLLHLIDDDRVQIERLRTLLERFRPYPQHLAVAVSCTDSRSLVPNLLPKLDARVPAFFLIDPYGHPLPVPMITTILQRRRAEVLINLMWFQINRDLNNPKVEFRLNELFGDKEWQSRPFMRMHGAEREKAFVAYFIARMGSRYVLQFGVRYDIEDIQSGRRTKYYLLHVSNHVKAALLMKEVMWPLGDEEGTAGRECPSMQR